MTQAFIESHAKLLFWNKEIFERLSQIWAAAKEKWVYYYHTAIKIDK